MVDKDNFYINYSCFNTKNDCLLCSTSNGVIIYNINPFRIAIKSNFQGGVSFFNQIDRSNIFIIVGTGINQEFPLNRAIIWDENKKKKLAEVSINEKIIGIKTNINKYLFIYSRSKGYLYNLENLEKLMEIKLNHQSLSYNFSDENNYILTYPVIKYDNIGKIIVKSTTKHLEIIAHNDSIQKLCVSNNGKYIATCSVKGNLIKLFTIDGILVKEYNRGNLTKKISYLGFSNNCKWLICASEYSSLHLFNLYDFTLSPITIFRDRATFVYKLKDIIYNCHINDNNNCIVFNSNKNIYLGKIENNKLVVTKSFLLVIEQDPFSLSPNNLKKSSLIKGNGKK